VLYDVPLNLLIDLVPVALNFRTGGVEVFFF
jgi:hypothetical protein